MKLFVGFLTLLLALIISGVAAYFSVVGLAAIFSATAGAVVIMGCALEAGKLVSAGWLHSNWANPKVNKLHKGYMVAAVCALMVITALGIYGFLAKGHLEEQTPLASVELAIAQKQARIDQINTDVARLTTQQSQMTGAVNAVISKDASKGLRTRGKLNAESKDIQTKIDADNTQINALTSEMVPLKLQINEVETKLGPVKYVADLFGLKDTEGAVRIVILILMFAFDPLAVVLVLSAAISFGDAFEERNRPKTVLPIANVDIPMPPVQEPLGVYTDIPDEDQELEEDVSEPKDPLRIDLDLHNREREIQIAEEAARAEAEAKAVAGNLLIELESVIPEMTDKERLLDILERKPELLQNIVEAVREDTPKTDSWLDLGPAK